MNKVAHKIFLACFSAFLVVLIGFSSIAVVFNNMRAIYKESINEGIENTIYMDKIRKLVNQELLTSSFYILQLRTMCLNITRALKKILVRNLQNVLATLEKE